MQKLESFGFEITILNVDKFGRISIEELVSSLRKDTILVSVMMANNEIGTIHPIKKLQKYVEIKILHFILTQASVVRIWKSIQK